MAASPPPPAGDLALRWDVGDADLALLDEDLDTDAGLETAVVLSLFTDRRAEADDALPGGDDRRGWWGDEFAATEGDRMGSRLWLLERSKRMPGIAAQVEEYVREALAWMVADGVASKLDVVVEQTAGGLAYAVGIHRPDGKTASFRFADGWDAEAAKAVRPSTEAIVPPPYRPVTVTAPSKSLLLVAEAPSGELLVPYDPELHVTAPAATLPLVAEVPTSEIGLSLSPTAPSATLPLVAEAPALAVGVTAPAASVPVTAAAPTLSIGITAPAATDSLIAATPTGEVGSPPAAPPDVTGVSTVTKSNSGTTYSPTMPSSIGADDILLCVAWYAGNTGNGAAPAAPSGWTKLDNGINSLGIYYKQAAGGDSAPEFSGNWGFGIRGFVVKIGDGLASGSPFDISVFGSQGTGNVSVGDQTTIDDHDLVLFIAGATDWDDGSYFAESVTFGTPTGNVTTQVVKSGDTHTGSYDIAIGLGMWKLVDKSPAGALGAASAVSVTRGAGGGGFAQGAIVAIKKAA